MKPEELAKRLDPKDYQKMRQALMQRIVLVVQANVQRRTHVLTGNLRRSWTSRVEKSGERGVIGTSVAYAPYQRNQPAEEGLEDSLTTIQQLAKDAGEELFVKVSK